MAVLVMKPLERPASSYLGEGEGEGAGEGEGEGWPLERPGLFVLLRLCARLDVLVGQDHRAHLVRVRV